MTFRLWVLLCALVVGSEAFFYIPYLKRNDYARGAEVPLTVVKLDSVLTQVPYDYYSLPFCGIEDKGRQAENLGEQLSGDILERSPYVIQANHSQMCVPLCQRRYSHSELEQFATRIREEYSVNVLIDENLPATTPMSTENGIVHQKGYSLGFVGTKFMENAYYNRAYLNNHISIRIAYHEDPSFEGLRIVGFQIEPYSVRHEIVGHWRDEDTEFSTCSGAGHIARKYRAQAVEGAEVHHEDDRVIYWTYDVHWDRSDNPWSTRFNVYLNMTNSQIHWFSIVNSMVIVLFLSAFVAMIMVRTLRKDLQTYNAEPLSLEEQREETGWKLVHGDVFRSPRHGNILSVFVGSGVQLFSMALLTLIFALFGILSPAYRGSLVTALLVLFVFMGAFGGYASTRVYTMFQLETWKTNTLWTAVFFPGICFTVFTFINIMLSLHNSSAAASLQTMLTLIVLWFGISIPLVYLGADRAIRQEPITPPIGVNTIPMTIPPGTDWFSQSEFSILVGGVLPFAAAFIEIFFIMSSVWRHEFYYVFPFLFVVFLILIITCAEITIVMVYFQLCHGNYHWWWRSFLTAGSSSLYLFLYSTFYFMTKLPVEGTLAAVLFFGYMSLASFAFFLVTGTIGFISCYLFVRKIYASVKIV